MVYWRIDAMVQYYSINRSLRLNPSQMAQVGYEEEDWEPVYPWSLTGEG